MLKAIAPGTLAQSALLLSGLLVYWINVPRRFVGNLAGFGAGALIEAIAFDFGRGSEGSRSTPVRSLDVDLLS